MAQKRHKAEEARGDGLISGFYVVMKELDDVLSRSARQENFRHSLFLESRQIFLRNDTTDEHENVVHSFFTQQLDDARAEGVVSTTQYRNADGINVLLKRGCGDHLGCLPQSRVDDFHACIAQGSGDDFCSAVMTIKARLRDQNSNFSS